MLKKNFLLNITKTIARDKVLINILQIISILIFLPCLNYAADSSEVKLIISPEHIIAKVGNIKITADEFLNGYEFGPAFIKRDKDSKKKYLDFMIYEKLLALEGYKKNYDDSEDVKQYLNEIRNDLSTELLYRDSIWSKIKVPENEIRLALAKDNIEMELKWIFEPSKEQISEQVQQLKLGIPFDTLFVRQFNDTVSYDDRYLKTTRFKLDKMNPVLASITDTLKIGDTSLPIKTEDGFYIVKISNVWQNVINTESEMNEKYSSMEKYLIKQKADSASDLYVNRLLSGEDPVIVRLTFNILKSWLAKKYLSPEKYTGWNTKKNIAPFISDFNDSRIDKYTEMTLIHLKRDSVSLKQFMNWYSNREPYIRFDLKSPQDFNNSLQNIVWRMLRDNLLAEVAERNNYHKNPELLKEIKWWKDKIVYSKFKLELAQNIKIEPKMVEEYYKQHNKDYLNEKGELKPFDEIKDDVRNDLYVYEYTKNIVNKVLTLKNKYKIQIDSESLVKLRVSEESNPRAIEMYTVKKGGTFIRPAYPTIDYEWQFWN